MVEKDIYTNPLFIELCRIVYERNEICRKRTRIRNKINVLNAVSKNMTVNGHIKKWESLAKTSTKKGVKFDNKCVALKEEAPNYETSKLLLEVIDANKRSFNDRILHAKEELAKLSEKRHIPRTHKNKRQSDLRLEIAYLERDRAQIAIDQFEFTDRTRKKQSQLIKKLELRLRRARYYNRIDGLTTNDGQYINACDLEEIAVNDIHEEIMVASTKD